MGKYTQKPRAMQMNLFNLHCRGATGYVAKPNISEAESIFEGATEYVAAGQISQKPRACKPISRKTRTHPASFSMAAAVAAVV